jgi:hypothetical protein
VGSFGLDEAVLAGEVLCGADVAEQPVEWPRLSRAARRISGAELSELRIVVRHLRAACVAIAAGRPLTTSRVAGGDARLRGIVIASTGLRRERRLGAQRVGIAHQAIDFVIDF